MSGYFQGGSNSISQVDGISDMAPELAGSVEGGFRKETMASASHEARHCSSSLYATGSFQAVTPVLELRGSEFA